LSCHGNVNLLSNVAERTPSQALRQGILAYTYTRLAEEGDSSYSEYAPENQTDKA